MKNTKRIAVITISKNAFLRYCQINGLDETNAKQVSIKKDIENEEFSWKIEIEENANVTDWVKNNIKVLGYAEADA